MGLPSRITGNQPAGAAGDDVLLLHGMLLMCGADGVMEGGELSTLEAYFHTIPEFDGKEFDDLLTQANKVVARYGNLQESVKALSEIESPAIRQKLFVIAADIAMSSGDVDESEDKMLDTMQRLLNIDDGTAGKVLEVLSMKYAV